MSALRRTRPSYLVLVADAVQALNKRSGSSYAAICGSIERTYCVPAHYRRYVVRALRDAVECEILLKEGARYRLTKTFRQRQRARPAKQERKGRRKKARGPAVSAVATTITPGSATATSTAATTPAVQTTPHQHAFKWQYDDKGWHDYDVGASDIVEAAYQHYLKNPGMNDVRSVSSGHWHYQVDFMNMRQTNIQHESHTTRLIRRVPVNSS